MSCSFYKWDGGLFGGDYYCIKKDGVVSSDIYSRYCRDWNYSECPIYKKENSSPPCFITTILCNVLGKQDDDKVLNNMRFFRENVLKNDPKYYEILMDYDYIGPTIACKIQHDPEKLN